MNLTHFERCIADALSATRPAGDVFRASQWWSDVVSIANRLEDERDRFDRAEFIETCGGMP